MSAPLLRPNFIISRLSPIYKVLSLSSYNCLPLEIKNPRSSLYLLHILILPIWQNVDCLTRFLRSDRR